MYPYLIIITYTNSKGEIILFPIWSSGTDEEDAYNKAVSVFLPIKDTLDIKTIAATTATLIPAGVITGYYHMIEHSIL